VKAWKIPSVSSGAGGVLILGQRHIRGSHGDKPGCPEMHAGNKLQLSGLIPERGAPMPPWLELLLNVIFFAGFIGIAKYHKSRGEKLPDS
jgi:hypothetical protein